MANRLAASTSPYLQQHADNPVDWYPWGEEAFAAARVRDVPVFLSVGYSACHWCHVMAHESFEDPATAEVLNAGFVPVKVDREERPDVDSVYMGATQAMTGHGGWPMSVMLNANGEPFYAGTYYPPEPRHGMPSFRQVLDAVSEAWRDRRTDIEQVGSEVAAHLRESAAKMAGQAPSDDGVDLESLGEEAVRRLRPTFDEARGGFGGAPKFPPSMVCEFLLRRSARNGDDEALQMAGATLEAMARGGIYDQLAGGFARYSVDAEWRVPHFEKMLYDNALLLSTYLHWWRQTGSALAERVARETAEFLLREMRTPQGGFASALDADSEGREGAFYVWTPAELRDVLGDEAGVMAAARFQVTASGPVEGASTLLLPKDPADLSQHRELTSRLLAARERRVRPARDDKVVAAWNGLAIGALAEAGILLQDERFLDGAVVAAQLLVDLHLADDGRLRRVSRDGVVGEPTGVLEDYASVAEGLLTLFSTTGDTSWYEHAQALTEQVVTRFADDAGGFFDTARDAEQLVSRPQDPTDNATPSGSATMASVFATLFGLTGVPDYRLRAERLVGLVSGLARQAPRFAGKALGVAEALADGPEQVAVIGAPGDPVRAELVRAAFRLPAPGLVIAQGDGAGAVVPLLESRGLVDGRPAAYLCHDFVCDLPVTDPAALGATST